MLQMASSPAYNELGPIFLLLHALQVVRVARKVRVDAEVREKCVRTRCARVRTRFRHMRVDQWVVVHLNVVVAGNEQEVHGAEQVQYKNY